MRHQAITKLAESGASEQTIMSLAGHVSRKMLEHYSHIRLEAKRQAVRALSSRKNTRETDGHVTERVTVETGNEEGLQQLLKNQSQPQKNLVDVRGFEPLTPCLQSIN
jgi:hypothetical protein